jgi:hypothetical protein
VPGRLVGFEFVGKDAEGGPLATDVVEEFLDLAAVVVEGAGLEAAGVYFPVHPFAIAVSELA